MITSAIRKVIPNSLLTLARRTCWNAIGLKSTTASGMKLKITNPGDWYVFNEIFVRAEYDEAIELALSKANQHLTVLDLGANVGLFSCRVLDLADRRRREGLDISITAVEGDPVVFEQLKHRIDETAGLNSSVFPVFGLIGSRTGTGKISHSEFAPQSSIMRLKGGSTVEVPFVDLEPTVKMSPVIDLVKCDIEGAEELFIENYIELLGRTQAAIFEFHNRLCNVPRCVELLTGTGLALQTKSTNGKDTFTALFVRQDQNQAR